tara:strand:+ start:2513 stop:2686 length:174 start_codon:yes stop_codon:yes gene_type:complete
MFKTPSEAIVTKNKDESIKYIKTPYDDDYVLNSPIDSLGKENNKILRTLFKSFNDKA